MLDLFGKIPIMNHVKSRMINLYMRLLNGKMSKFFFAVMFGLMRKKYEMENDHNPKWLDMVSSCLANIGMNDVWITQCDDFTHYNDVILSAMASQITSLTIVCWTIYSRRRSKKTSKLCVTGLCAGNSPVTGEFLAQRASNAENVSIWWRHHENMLTWLSNIDWKIHMFNSDMTSRSVNFITL